MGNTTFDFDWKNRDNKNEYSTKIVVSVPVIAHWNPKFYLAKTFLLVNVFHSVPLLFQCVSSLLFWGVWLELYAAIGINWATLRSNFPAASH